MKVLGLDVSTSNVGICIIDTGCPQGSRVRLAYGIPLTKVKGLWTKSCELRDHLERLALHHTIDLVVVEESLQAFRSRMSSAGTIAKLNRFNGIACYIAKLQFDCPLYLANVISTRKAVGCAINRKSPMGTKDQVMQWVKDHVEMQAFDWPVKTLKGGKNKGTIRMQDICYDIADAFVVTLFAADVLKNDDIDATLV